MTDLGRLDASSGSHAFGPKRPEERAGGPNEADGSAERLGDAVPTLGGGLDDSDALDDDSDVLALELDRLITEYFDAQREGRAPTVEDYVAAHPEHEHALRAVLPGANLLDQMGKRAEDASPQARSGDRLGEYKLLGILGRGGMGVVYEAVQETLGRPVALKVLPASRVVDRKSRERFMREAQAAASLQHPGIVPVYGVGEADGQVYYAMQRVDGVPLDVLSMVARGESAGAESSVLVERAISVVSRLRGNEGSGGLGSSSEILRGGELRSDARVAAGSSDHLSAKPWISNSVRIAQQVAEALSYAHSRGVLHRDIKPSNVMLDESGRAYVTDFGLCKVEDSSSLTAAGDVVGTLRYVPPERFQGRDDARGDVYGVGMILYELLCGRPAFDQKDRATLVQAVTLHAPPRPRKLNPEIPEDLERIVLAATAKLPEERYSSAESLIADLAAFQEGRPIRARAPGKLYLAKLFARRNRGLVITAAAATALIAVLGILYVRDLGRLLNEVEAGRSRAERMFYHAQVHAAVEAARNNNGGAARALRILDSIEPSQRDWVWENMQARCDVGLMTVDRGARPILTMALDSSEEHVAVVRRDHVRVHRATTGELLHEIACAGAKGAAFVPGTLDLMIVEGEERTLRLAPPPDRSAAETSERLFGELQVSGASGVMAMDATEGYFAYALASGKAAIFRADHGWERASFEVKTGDEMLLSLFGTDGRAAFAARRQRLCVLGPEAGRVRLVPGEDASRVSALAGAHQSRYFVAQGPAGYAVRYLDGDNERLRRGDRTVREAATTQLAISPDGHTVIAQFRYGKARIWEKTRGPSMARTAAYLAEPTAVLWPEGGEEMIVGGKSGEWRVLPRPGFDAGIPGVSEVRGHYSDVSGMALDGTGKFLAVGEENGAWSVWSVERHLPVSMEFRYHIPIEHMALCSANGQPHALAVAGEEVGVWTMPGEVVSGASYDSVFGPVEACGIAWRTEGGSAAPNELIFASEDGTVRVATRDAEGSWSCQIAWSADARLTAFDHHRGAGLTVVASDDGRVWRLSVSPRTGALEADLMATLDREVTAVGIGTLAEAVALFTDNRDLHLIDMNQEVPQLRWSVQASSHGYDDLSTTAVAVDEASGWIATAGADGALQLWSSIDGMPGPLLEMRYGVFRGVEFPQPNSAPISVEERGRVTFIETQGAQRLRELASIVPSNAERLVVMFLAPRVRLGEIEKLLKKDSVSRAQLEAARKTTQGLAAFGKFYNNVSRAEAERVLEQVEVALEELAGPAGLAD